MAADPYKYFRVEAHELVDQLGKGLLELEQGSATEELVPRLLRLTHTLKGAARVVRQPEIADLAHQLEALVNGARAGGPVAVDGMLKLLDAIRVRTVALDAPAVGSGPQIVREEPPGRAIRADAAEVDALLDGLAMVEEQLTVVRRCVPGAERARRLAQLLANQLASPRGGAQARPLADELRELLEGLEDELQLGTGRVDVELRQVREAAERLRLVPARSMFHALERAARDAAHSLGRPVRVETMGGDVRLDAQVLAVVQPALVQAVRNAVAHGIEAPRERAARGKPADGLVRLVVTQRGHRVSFTCQDDGRGVDVEAVRGALRRSAVPGVDELGVDGLIALLLRGGITTSGTVTEVAGRGIGLDVVRDAARQLGGEVHLRTETGRGTTLELAVPVSVASLETLLVEAGGQVAALPLDAIAQTLRVQPADIAEAAGGASILFEGQAIPFAPLEQFLPQASASRTGPRAWSVVVLRGAEGRAAVGLDRLRGTEQVTIRPLPALAPRVPCVAGATMDADGNPMIVLDAEGVLQAVTRRTAARPRPAPAREPILIIDDSLTTRMLEQSILESAGYEVDLATSGEEALELARKRRYALFLVDVEMPGMDGFTFIERTQADPTLRDIPAVLVTSRDSAEDRRRGLAAGARAHIIKSEFDQARLLDQIRTLVRSR